MPFCLYLRHFWKKITRRGQSVSMQKKKKLRNHFPFIGNECTCRIFQETQNASFMTKIHSFTKERILSIGCKFVRFFFYIFGIKYCVFISSIKSSCYLDKPQAMTVFLASICPICACKSTNLSRDCDLCTVIRKVSSGKTSWAEHCSNTIKTYFALGSRKKPVCR